MKRQLGGLKRKTESRYFRKKILIICCGVQTEPNYFRGFPIPPEYNVVINSDAVDSLNMAKNAIQIMKTEMKRSFAFTECWVVFDKDSFLNDNFDNAIWIIEKNKLHVAYSNQCFELWYLLHFELLQSSLNRSDYWTKVTTYLGTVKYQKNSTDMYDRLKDNQEYAIKNAEKLLEQHEGKTCAKADPSTTVHLLVQRLNTLWKAQV